MTVEEISQTISELEHNMKRRHVPDDVAILTRLSVEDTVCKFRERLGEDADINVRMRGLITPYIVVTAKGKFYNPLEENIPRHLLRFVVSLSHAGVAPTFTRHSGINTIVYKLPRREIGDLQCIILAVVMAIIAALIMHGTMSQNAISTCVKGVLDPLCGVFLGLLSAVVVPLIFSSVIKAVMNAGDGDAMSKMGRMLFQNVLGTNVMILLLAVTVCMLTFGIVPDAAGVAAGKAGETTMGTFLDMFFPKNIVQTFEQGKTAQVLFVAIVTGFALLRLRERGRLICDFVTQTNELMMLFMSWMSKLLPIFIFLQLLILILSGGTAVFAQFGKMLVVYYAQNALIYLAFMLYGAHRMGISCTDYIKRTSKVFLIGMSTMSSVMSIPTMIECGEKQMGIDRKFCEVMVPTVVTMSRITPVSTMTYIALCGVNIYDISVSWQMICMYTFFAFILSIATPAVPGGVIATLAMLFGILGVPMEYIGMVAMLVPFMELNTGVQTTGVITQVLTIAKKIGKQTK